jgi:hypothetical protein
MSNLVEIGTGRVIILGGSHYLLIPANIRKQLDVCEGNEFTYSREAESPDLVLKKVTAEKK